MLGLIGISIDFSIADTRTNACICALVLICRFAARWGLVHKYMHSFAYQHSKSIDFPYIANVNVLYVPSLGTIPCVVYKSWRLMNREKKWKNVDFAKFSKCISHIYIKKSPSARSYCRVNRSISSKLYWQHLELMDSNYEQEISVFHFNTLVQIAK